MGSRADLGLTGPEFRGPGWEYRRSRFDGDWIGFD